MNVDALKTIFIPLVSFDNRKYNRGKAPFYGEVDKNQKLSSSTTCVTFLCSLSITGRATVTQKTVISMFHKKCTNCMVKAVNIHFNILEKYWEMFTCSFLFHGNGGIDLVRGNQTHCTPNKLSEGSKKQKQTITSSSLSF